MSSTSSAPEFPSLAATGSIHTSELDERGDTSPLRLLRAMKVLQSMGPGELLKIVTSDAQSLREYRVLAASKGFVLISQERVGDAYVHLMAPVGKPSGDPWEHDPQRPE